MTQTDTTGTGPAVITVDRFSIATPSDWTRLPLDPATRDQRIAQMVEREFGTNDQNARLKRQKIVRLRKAAADAAEAGAFFAALNGRIVNELPMAASAMASLLPTVKDAAGEPLTTPETIAAEITRNNSNEKTQILDQSVGELPIGRAARIILRGGGTEFHSETGEEVIGQATHYYIPLVEAQKTLALIFSTPVLPLADAYTELFDVMAASAAWQQADDAPPSPGPNQQQ